MCFGILAYHYSDFAHSLGMGFPVFGRFAYFTDIFFVISGFFLARQYGRLVGFSSYVDFVRQRLARVYPLHFFVAVFFVLLAILGWLGLTNGKVGVDTQGWFFNFLLMHGWGFSGSMSLNHVSWSLSTLFAMYLLYPVLHKIMGLGRCISILALLVFLFCFDKFTRDLHGLPLTSAQHCDLGVLRTLPSFCFGVWLALYERRVLGRPASSIVCILSCALLFFYSGVIDGVLRLVLIYVSVFSFLQLDLNSVKTPLSASVFGDLAKYGFGVYLLHPAILILLYGFVSRYFAVDLFVLWSVFILGVFFTFIAAVVSYRVIEAPAQRFFLSLTGGRRF